MVGRKGQMEREPQQIRKNLDGSGQFSGEGFSFIGSNSKLLPPHLPRSSRGSVHPKMRGVLKSQNTRRTFLGGDLQGVKDACSKWRKLSEGGLWRGQ